MKENSIYVGIFWAVPDIESDGWQFFEDKIAVLLNCANSLGFIDYPHSHYEKWDEVRAGRGTDDCYFYPRGRVLYDTNQNEHRIFADECLNECDLKEIIEQFEIKSFKLMRDEHYVSMFSRKVDNK